MNRPVAQTADATLEPLPEWVPRGLLAREDNRELDRERILESSPRGLNYDERATNTSRQWRRKSTKLRRWQQNGKWLRARQRSNRPWRDVSRRQRRSTSLAFDGREPTVQVQGGWW